MWLAFLDQVSAVVEAATNEEDIVRGAVRLAIPTFADSCLIALNRGGALEHAAIDDGDPAREAWLCRAAADLTDHGPLRDGQACILEAGELGGLVNVGLSALLVAPLVSQGHKLGVIAYGAGCDRHFDRSDVPVAVEAARRISAALDNARHLADAARAALVADARQELADSGDAASIAAKLQAVIVPRAADRCVLLLCAEDGTLHCPTQEGVLPGDATLAARALSAGRPINGNDHVAGTCLAAPVNAHGDALGALIVEVYPPRVLTPADSAAIPEIAQRAAQALQTARLRASERIARKRAETLVALTSVLARARRPTDVAEVLVRDVARAVGASLAWVARAREDRHQLEPIAASGAGDARPEDAEAWRAIRGRTPSWSADGRAVVTPLVADGRCVGVARFVFAVEPASSYARGTPAPHAPKATSPQPRNVPGRSAEELELFAAMCAQCSQALDRALAYDESRAASERLSYLAEAGKELARSLDVASTMATLARLAVPQLALRAEVDLVTDVTPAPPPSASEDGLVAIPLVARGLPRGALVLHPGPNGIDDERLELAAELARRGAMAIENARLYEREHAARAAEREARSAAEAAEGRARFLSRASAVLGESLDIEASLPLIAQMCTPLLADWCVLEGGEPGRATLAYAHADPTHTSLLRRVSHVPAIETPSDIGADLPLDALFPDPCARETVERLGARALMLVPLNAGGRALGAMLFARTDRERAYRPAEIGLARELARRVALAVEHARLYAQAREAVALRDRLTAVIAHDLRNPLAAIRLASDVLLSAGLQESARRNCESISRCARHMSAIVEDLIEVHRMQSGTPSVDLRPEPVFALVRSATELCGPLAAAKGLLLHAPDCDERLSAMCDARRVLQVLSNLTGNAIKFTPRGGRISITCEASADWVAFSIRDTGPGIAPEHRARVFEPFWRANERGPGLGLGLAIAKGIVSAHGGDIDVQSSPGQGCAVRFTLPRA